jgi:hypothetical protein
MRDRDTILSELYFKKQWQGTLVDKAILETLLDIRDLLSKDQ